MNHDLTEEEMVYYANYNLIEFCDCCGDYFPFEKIFCVDNGRFYCYDCLK